MLEGSSPKVSQFGADVSLKDHVIEKFPLIISVYDSPERTLIIFTDIVITSAQHVTTAQCSAVKTLEPAVTVDAK